MAVVMSSIFVLYDFSIDFVDYDIDRTVEVIFS